MAPSKNKKKVNAASKSTPGKKPLRKGTSKELASNEKIMEDVKGGEAKESVQTPVSGKKPLKRGKSIGIVAESTSEEVSYKKLLEDDKVCDAKESVPTPVVKKPCTWLKLDRLNPQNGNKSSLQSSKQDKEEKPTTQAQAVGDNKRKRNEKVEEKGHRDRTSYKKHIDSHEKEKEKVNVKDRHEDTRKDESEKSLGGLIFMCNAKTKPDCFHYQVMGVPASKKEVVMNIKPGLKIFLYDYDLKLMYGVYEASSPGGMKLEPAAFGGAFPAQVRFIVHKDCIPLPESVFKKAIKDSYDERTRKFKTEVTVKQLKNLIDLFQPTPWLHPKGRSVVPERTISPVPPTTLLRDEFLMRQRYLNNYGDSETRQQSVPLHHEKQFSDYHGFGKPVPPQDPLFLTEEEYRSHGLRQGRQLLPTTSGVDVNHTLEPNKLDLQLKQLLRNPASTSTESVVQQRDVNQPDSFFLSEKEYRTYGLRGPQNITNAAPPLMTANPIVKESCDPYDESTTELVNRYLAMPMPAESSHPVGGREPYTNNVNHEHERSIINQRLYSLNAPNDLSEINRGGINHQQGTNLASAPVSNRYSFNGPSLSQHR